MDTRDEDDITLHLLLCGVAEMNGGGDDGVGVIDLIGEW